MKLVIHENVCNNVLPGKNVFHIPGYITGLGTQFYLNIPTKHKDDILLQRFCLPAEMMALMLHNL